MDVLLDEVESLEAILMDDVKITKNAETNMPEMIETVVLPTVGDKIESQYVCITLQVIFTANYPDAKPMYQLRNSRGLDDMSIAAIRAAVEAKLTESIGAPVVFDLIDVVREHLTHSNVPSGQCVVCLYGFQHGDDFTKTECYHYLHSYCLARHLDASQRNYQEEVDKLPGWQQKSAKPFQASCPVCREPISRDVDRLRDANQPVELLNAPDFQLTSDLKTLQARMSNLYLHQKQQGGIIDLAAEETNVISIQTEADLERHSRKSNSKKSAPKQPQTEVQANQARQAAALKLRNATMAENGGGGGGDDEDEDDDDDDDDKRRRHGRRGGNRHKNKRSFHASSRHGKCATATGASVEHADEASGSHKR